MQLIDALLSLETSHASQDRSLSPMYSNFGLCFDARTAGLVGFCFFWVLFLQSGRNLSFRRVHRRGRNIRAVLLRYRRLRAERGVCFPRAGVQYCRV